MRDNKGIITVFDPPNASRTLPRGINAAGEITGEFGDTKNGNNHRGFVRDNKGVITVFDPPNSFFALPVSINAAGEITGFFQDLTTHAFRGFVRDP